MPGLSRLLHPECVQNYVLYERSLRIACVKAPRPLRCVLVGRESFVSPPSTQAQPTTHTRFSLQRHASPSQLQWAFAEVVRRHGNGEAVSCTRPAQSEWP